MFHRALKRLATTVTVLLATGAVAQPTGFGGRLETGFGLRTTTGALTGEVDAALFGETESGRCAGFIATAPSHRITLGDDMPDLVLYLEPYGPQGSLVVHGPDGTRCSGVPVGGAIRLDGPWPAGRYTVYVGTVSQYDWLSYELYVAENESQLESIARGGTSTLESDPGGYMGSLYGEVTGPDEIDALGTLDSLLFELIHESSDAYTLADLLAEGSADTEDGGIILHGAGPGFDEPSEGGGAEARAVASPESGLGQTPRLGRIQIDPGLPPLMMFTGSTDGSIDVSALAVAEGTGCRGFIESDPTYEMVLRDTASSLTLTVEAPSNPVLLVAGPTDSASHEPIWDCAVGDGTTATLSSTWQPGTYLIWIGTDEPPGSRFNLTLTAD